MPIIGNSLIGANGVVAGSPTTVGAIPKIQSLGPPPVLDDSVLRQFDDAGLGVITIGAVDVAIGEGSSEQFRLSTGFISESSLSRFSFVAGEYAFVDEDSPGAIAIGYQASISNLSPGAVAIGDTASASGRGVAIGLNASANGDDVIVGGSAASSGQRMTSLGAGTGVTTDGVAVGYAAIGDQRNVVVGASASSAGLDSVCVGFEAINNFAGGFPGDGMNVIIGTRSEVFYGERCIIIGCDNVLFGDAGTTTPVEQTIVIGHGLPAPDAGANTPNNTLYLGTPLTDIQNVIIGAGEEAAAPAAVRFIRFTNAVGTDVSAGSIFIQAPLSTGDAGAGNGFFFAVSALGASGTTLQSPFPALAIDYPTGAGETALTVYDVDSGNMLRMLVGAAGTGPGGVGRALYLV